MPRSIVMAVLLSLAAGLTSLAATVLPVAGVYPLTETVNMESIKFGEKDEYCAFGELTSAKPADLELRTTEEVSNAHYYEVRLGARSLYLVVGKTKDCPDIAMTPLLRAGQPH